MRALQLVGQKFALYFKVSALNIAAVLYAARTKEGTMDIDLGK